MISILIVLLVLLPFVIGLCMWKRSRKLAIICFFSLSFAILVPTGLHVTASNYYFIKDTDLSGEHLDHVELLQFLTNDLIDELGDFESHDDVLHALYLGFDEAQIATNDEHKINSISSTKAGVTTASGVAIGDSIQEAKGTYGSQFVSGSDSSIDSSIFYVDRENNARLEFIYNENEQIKEIRLSELEATS